MRNIAFCVDDADRVCSLQQAAAIRVYERSRTGWWRPARDLPVPGPGEVPAALSDCVALVCLESPEAFATCEQAGLWVWELPGDPLELAEVVWQDQMAA